MQNDENKPIENMDTEQNKEKSVRCCRNKECNRILPDNYKYKYCENCRRKKAAKRRKVLGTIGATLTAFAAIYESIADETKEQLMEDVGNIKTKITKRE